MSAYAHGNYRFGLCRESVNHCPDKWYKTMIFHFLEEWGSLSVVSQRTGRKNRMRRSPLNKARLPVCSWGSPHCSDSWCSMLGNQRVEMFSCCIFYCLLHLGHTFPFHPTLAVMPLLPVLLRLGGRQLSFNWRKQAQALVLANIHRPESLRMTLNPLLLTLDIDLPVKRGTNKENWVKWDLDL